MGTQQAETQQTETGSNDREYKYAASQVRSVLAVAFFSASGMLMHNMSATNTRGLLIDGFIHLDASEANVLYLIMSLFAFGLVAFALAHLYFGAANPQSVKLSDQGFYAYQHLWSKAPIFIRYRDVFEAKEKTWRRRGLMALTSDEHAFRMMIITYPGGKLQFSVTRFQDQATYDEFCAELYGRTQADKAARGVVVPMFR